MSNKDVASLDSRQSSLDGVDQNHFLSAPLWSDDPIATSRPAPPSASSMFVVNFASPSAAPVRRSALGERRMPQGRDDEERLTADIIELARQYAATAVTRSRPCCGALGGRSDGDAPADVETQGKLTFGVGPLDGGRSCSSTYRGRLNKGVHILPDAAIIRLNSKELRLRIVVCRRHTTNSNVLLDLSVECLACV